MSPLIRALATLLLALGFATIAVAQSDCETRCMDNYTTTRYPSDQNLCMRSSAPGRCLDETRANARNFCRDRCNANYQAPAEKPAPALNLKGIQTPNTREPIPQPPPSTSGTRG